MTVVVRTLKKTLKLMLFLQNRNQSNAKSNHVKIVINLQSPPLARGENENKKNNDVEIDVL